MQSPLFIGVRRLPRRWGWGVSFRRGSTGVDLSLAAVLALWPSAIALGGEGPCLDFDFGRTLACRDVTPDDFAAAFPEEKVIEFTLCVSVHVASGEVNDVEELRIEISDPDRRMRVYAMSPETELTSSVTGEIEVTTTTEKSRNLNASLGGELPALFGDVAAHVTPSINGGGVNREITTEKALRLPPQQVVVASGTIKEQHGALFKLRPSAQTTLEGTHALTVQAAVPANWRGDAVQVRCRASGRERFLWMKQSKLIADETASVALFVAGDAAARHAAYKFISR